MDLFVNWACRDDFDDAVSAVTGALEKAGMKVEVVARGETFARLLVTDPAAGGEPDKVEVAADWRAHEPVMLDIGPVLHSDDAVANKMAALYGFSELGEPSCKVRCSPRSPQVLRPSRPAGVDVKD